MRIGAAVFFVMTFAGAGWAQNKNGAPPAQNSPAPQTKGAPSAAPVPQVETVVIETNLLQLMRGMMYPESNVIFFTQTEDPAKFPAAKDPSLATDLLASTFGKWAAVENSALSLAESANLLMLPGRKCANGNPVPIGNADWPKFVQELRDAGMKSYVAAQSKDMDKMIDASDVLSASCAHCHGKYREKRERCK